MNVGGPSCAVKTVDGLTGLTLDHFVMFNFDSFRPRSRRAVILLAGSGAGQHGARPPR